MSQGDPLLNECLQHLRALPGVAGARATSPVENGPDCGSDWEVQITKGSQSWSLATILHRSNLTKSALRGLMAVIQLAHPKLVRKESMPHLLFTPYISKKMGDQLAEAGINFVDRAGNCFLQLGDHYLIRKSGNPSAAKASGGRGPGIAGLKIYLALLIDPDLATAGPTKIAHAAGVHISTASVRLKKMKESGLLSGPNKLNVPLNKRRLFRNWAVGYEQVQRPKLLLGQYKHLCLNNHEFDQLLSNANGQPWKVGGIAAAYRHTQYHRGETTSIFVGGGSEAMQKKLKLVPAQRQANVFILNFPIPASTCVSDSNELHPFIHYAEMLCHGDDRQLDAAAEFAKVHQPLFADVL